MQLKPFDYVFVQDGVLLTRADNDQKQHLIGIIEKAFPVAFVIQIDALQLLCVQILRGRAVEVVAIAFDNEVELDDTIDVFGSMPEEFYAYELSLLRYRGHACYTRLRCLLCPENAESKPLDVYAENTLD